MKYEVEVTSDGRIDVPVPFPPGSQVVVFVVEQNRNGFDDLQAAAGSSLEFWNNPLDDEDWNDA